MPIIQNKRGLSLALAGSNPTPAAGEVIYETDTRRWKIGDGTTAWNSLAYGSGNVTNGNKGDITVSAAGETWTINAGAVVTADIADAGVTYAKIQNVSATDRLLGRSTAGAGVVQEITCTAFGRSLLDDADAATARTTLGAAPAASPTFTGNTTFSAGAVLVVTPDTFTGIRLRNNKTTTEQSCGFLSGMNINGVEDTGLLFFRNPSGVTTAQFMTTPSGSATVDRRNVTVSFSGDGWWDASVVGNPAAGLKPVGLCRGWILFNGTGLGPTFPQITGAINFSSITDNGVGDYTLNLGVAMPDTLYAVIGSCNWDGQSRAGVVGQNTQRTKTVSAVPIVVMQGATNTLFDTSHISVAIFR